MSNPQNLADKKCIPCENGACPIGIKDIENYMQQLNENWIVIKKTGKPKIIERHYDFPNFISAESFINEIGKIAEQEGHHPDLKLEYGYVHVSLHTHSIGGLSENDFILAAKIEELYSRNPSS